MELLEILGLVLIFIAGLIIGHLGLQDRYGAMASMFHGKYGTLYTGISYIACFGTIIYLAIAFTPWHVASGLVLMFIASRVLIYIYKELPLFSVYYMSYFPCI